MDVLKAKVKQGQVVHRRRHMPLNAQSTVAGQRVVDAKVLAQRSAALVHLLAAANRAFREIPLHKDASVLAGMDGQRVLAREALLAQQLGTHIRALASVRAHMVEHLVALREGQISPRAMRPFAVVLLFARLHMVSLDVAAELAARRKRERAASPAARSGFRINYWGLWSHCDGVLPAV